MKVPLQKIRCNFAHFALIRAVFLHPDTANQAQLLHKPLDSLVIQRQIAVAQFHRDAAIAVSASVFMVNCRNFFLDGFVLIYTVHPFQMIIECRTGQLSDGKKNMQRKVLPQLLDYQLFFNLLRKLLRRSTLTTAAATFYSQSFWAFGQIDAFPCCDSAAHNIKPPRCFAVAQLFFQHRFNHVFLEFRCVFLVWYSLWHINHPIC